MAALKMGDKVRIKPRQDWYLPSGYKPAGAEGKVVELIEEPAGYVMVALDKDVTGIDKHVPLAFRIEALEKI